MREINIDDFDDVTEISAFVSYKDYLELPQFKRYVKENGVVLPVKYTSAGEEVAVAEDVQSAKENKKINVAAILTAICALLFTVWIVIGSTVKLEGSAASAFALYDGQSALNVVKLLFGGKYADAADNVAAVACLLAVVAEICFGLVWPLTRLRKDGMGFAVIIGTFAAFALMMCAAIIGITKSSAVPMGAAVAASALAFLVSAIAGTGKKSVKENG